jgi:hypothetical protein
VDYPASRHGMTATDVTVADVPKCWTKLTETATKLGRKCKNVQTFVHVIFRVSYQKNKVIKKKFNFPSKKLNSSKKIFPHILACASQTQNTSIMKSVHCIKKNMFKLFFDDLNFFGGSLVKQLLLAEKVY